MADVDRAAVLGEAYRRGLLPPEMKSAYEEAHKRGLVGGSAGQNSSVPPGGAGGQAAGGGASGVPSTPQTSRDATKADRGAFQPVAATGANRGAFRTDPTHLDPTQLGNLADAAKNSKPVPTSGYTKNRAGNRGEEVTVSKPQAQYESQQQSMPGGLQALYDMLGNDPERYHFLSKYYGQGKVGRDYNGFYVKLDNGQKMYPTGAGVSGVASSAVAQALPTAGAMIGGAMGTAGGLFTGPGAFATATAGAGIGAGVGQAANDSILKAMGYTDRTTGEEATGLGLAALGGAVGEGVGRIIPDVALPLARGARSLMFKPQEDLDAVRALAEKGYRVNPREMGSQFFGRQVDLAKKTSGYDPLGESAARYAKDETQAMLERSGMSPEAAKAEAERMATSHPSLEEPGEHLKSAAAKDYADQEAELNRQVAEIRANAEHQGLGPANQLRKDTKTAQAVMTKRQAQVQAQIDAGFRDLHMARAADKPGALAHDTAEKIHDLRGKVIETANGIYEPAIAMAGDRPFDTSPLKDKIDAFMAEIPDDLKRNSPSLIQSLERMVAEGGEDAGEEGAERKAVNLAQLQRLRSQLRDVGYSKALTPDFKKGPYAMLAKAVDDVIHAPTSDPVLKAAVKEIDRGDKYYAKNMRQFQSRELQALADDVAAGLPSDARQIAKLAAEPGQTATLRRIQKIGGPELTRRIASADIDEILKASTDLGAKQPDARKFLNEVTDRYRSGMLRTVHGDAQAAKIVQLARRLAAKDGIIPIKDLTPDNFVRQLHLANQAADRAAELAKKDPVKLLGDAVAGGEAEIRKLTQDFAGRTSSGDILAFLRDPALLANKAAERILGNHLYLEQAIARYGENHPAIITLRQKALERLLAPVTQGEGGGALGKTLRDMPERAKELLFPGGMDKDLHRMADDLKRIVGGASDTAVGIGSGEALSKPLLQRLHLQYVYKLEAMLATHPKFIKAVSADLRSTGDIAKTLFKWRDRIAVGTAGAGGYLSGNYQGEGTDQGRDDLPAFDAAPERTGGWRQWDRSKGKSDMKKWERQ